MVHANIVKRNHRNCLKQNVEMNYSIFKLEIFRMNTYAMISAILQWTLDSK